MMHWKTDKIVADILKIPGVTKVKAYGPGGDFDTDNIVVSTSPRYSFFLSGYQEDTRNQPTDANNDREVYTVVVNDGRDSRGGCNTDNEKITQIYHAIRRYFSKRGASLANHYDEVF